MDHINKKMIDFFKYIILKSKMDYNQVSEELNYIISYDYQYDPNDMSDVMEDMIKQLELQ